MGISRIEWFVNAVKPQVNQNIVRICDDEMAYLRKNYETSSMRRALTNYRNAIKNAQMDDEKTAVVLKGLILSNDEKDKLILSKNKEISAAHSKLRPIYEIDRYIDVANGLLDESGYLLQIVGLCALTGRRAAEIGCTAKFSTLKDDPTKVLFEGQLKTKGRGELDAYTIPVLGDSKKIVETLNAIREKKSVYVNEPEKFHNAASKELNRRVKKLFSFVSDTGLSIKDLRAMYAELNYMFNDDPTITKNSYMASILGHGVDDLTTVNSYLDFYIADENYN
jgi:Telomere resolvase